MECSLEIKSVDKKIINIIIIFIIIINAVVIIITIVVIVIIITTITIIIVTAIPLSMSQMKFYKQHIFVYMHTIFVAKVHQKCG